MKWIVMHDKAGWPWLQGDGWTISKARVRERVVYTLWRGQRRIGDCQTASDAVAMQKSYSPTNSGQPA